MRGEVLGYFAAFFMGIVLGVIGGGGSILTVPILVYMMDITPVVSTGYSLLIVGLTAAFGAYRYYRQGMINVNSALTFAVPSIVAVYVTRAFIMPAIPDPIMTSPFIIGKGIAIMVLFAFLMISSAIMMFRNSKKLTSLQTPSQIPPHPTGLIILEGAIVGFVTGILGAGGGFLIIPALVLLRGMPMKEAVAASLLIIALKSLIGFIGDIQSGIVLEMPLLAFFVGATLSGMFLAIHISEKLDGKKIQQFFACFTFIIACIILCKELF